MRPQPQDWLKLHVVAFGRGIYLTLNAYDYERAGRTLFFFAVVHKGIMKRNWRLSWLHDDGFANGVCLEWKKAHSKDGCVLETSGWRLRGPLETIS
jgi:hypothetical protein